MGYKMKALKTFDGVEGFVKKGEEVEVVSKTRALALEERKLAKFVGEEEKKKTELSAEERIDAVTKHDDLTALVNELSLEDVPAKGEEGATLEKRKEAAKAALK